MKHKKRPVHPKEPGLGGKKTIKAAANSGKVLQASQPPVQTGAPHR